MHEPTITAKQMVRNFMMEHECINTFPKSTSIADLKRFLLLIGYQRDQGDVLRFFFFKRDDYKYHTGVEAEIKRAKGILCLHTWIELESNSFDREYQLLTVRQTRAHFGGSFLTNAGRNRFPRAYFPRRIGAESGCFIAFSRFQTNLGRINVFLSTREVQNFPPPQSYQLRPDRHPIILSNNLIVPFLVAAMEEFFRSSFVALLRYSDSRKRLFRNTRWLDADDLLQISSGVRSVEYAFARHRSFQNIASICDSFKELDKGLDLAKILKKRARHSRLSLLDSLRAIVEHRHDLIHRSRLHSDYLNKNIQRDIRCVQQAISDVYKFLVDYHGWQQLEE